jgi:predicted N-formylglutamate amidohydrolase
VSCEHAVNTVPTEYEILFAPHQDLIKSHRGIDFGALTIALAFHKNFNCDFVQANATRLLIDCNRSLSHRQCFSEVTVSLSKEEKEKLIQLYYLPFRNEVKNCIKKHIQQRKQVLHLSIHSFTPALNERERNTDLGLLYDPKRIFEKALTRRWQQQLQQQDANLRVRMNYPYRGISDGFTKELRKQFADSDYGGIEIEANQKLVENTKFLHYISTLLTQTLKLLIQ